jgi:hypothetical protein
MVTQGAAKATLSDFKRVCSYSPKPEKIECYRREELGVWTEQMYGVGDEVEFRSVDYRGSIESIYHKVPGLV